VSVWDARELACIKTFSRLEWPVKITRVPSLFVLSGKVTLVRELVVAYRKPPMTLKLFRKPHVILKIVPKGAYVPYCTLEEINH
jgi:hypothetical protein